MKHTSKLIWIIAAIFTFGTVFLFLQKTKEEKKLDKIAQEGYETAEDILFPLSQKKYRRA